MVPAEIASAPDRSSRSAGSLAKRENTSEQSTGAASAWTWEDRRRATRASGRQAGATPPGRAAAPRTGCWACAVPRPGQDHRDQGREVRVFDVLQRRRLGSAQMRTVGTTTMRSLGASEGIAGRAFPGRPCVTEPLAGGKRWSRYSAGLPERPPWRPLQCCTSRVLSHSARPVPYRCECLGQAGAVGVRLSQQRGGFRLGRAVCEL